jgi:hypothetical protein
MMTTAELVPGIFAIEVRHWDWLKGRRGTESIQDHGGAGCAELAGDELSALFQGSGPWGPGPEADQALQVSEGPVRVKLTVWN